MRPSQLPASILLTFAASVWAGAPADKTPMSAVQPPAGNPLQFGNVTFSLQERLRGEWRENNYDFDSSKDALTDDSWLEERTRVGVDWQATPWLNFYVEGQDTREFFADRPSVLGKLGAEGNDSFDLRQASMTIGNPDHLSLQIGRQTLVYGDKRLISSGEWSNPSRTFDAVKLHYQMKDGFLDAFVSSVVKPVDGEFNTSTWFDGEDNNQYFSGLYYSNTALGFQTTDLYVLEQHLDEPGGTDFATFGTRWRGDELKLGGWDYKVQIVGQAGEVKGKDLTAMATRLEAGYNWLDHPWKPRLGLEYSYASGDKNANDGKVGTFQNLYATNHLYYGYMDLFAWQNLRNPVIHFSVEPVKDLTVMLEQHWFWLANTNDSWYRGSLNAVDRPISPAASSYAGSELDFTVAWKASKYLDVQAGYSHFFAGSYLKDTGAHDDADFAYLMVTINL